MNFTNPRAEKSRSQSKNNQETQFRISYTATGQELIYGHVPVGIDLAGRKFQVCFYVTVNYSLLPRFQFS